MNGAAFLLILSLVGCGAAAVSGDKGAQQADTTSVDTTSPPAHLPIRPGTCRILGRLVAVDSSLITADTSDPCSRAPCRGAVLVEELEGFGPNFPDYLVQRGDRITVTFPGTLLPYVEHFNGMLVNAFPGLTIGSRFHADVALEISDGFYEDPANDGSLTIYSYVAIEKKEAQVESEK